MFLYFVRYNEVPSEDPMHEGFLKRLKTFDVFNWSGKPIDPPHCAKHGWEIAEKDVLKCVMCHRYLSVSLPSPTKNLPCKEVFQDSLKISPKLLVCHR